jgi:hypothetical protein
MGAYANYAILYLPGMLIQQSERPISSERSQKGGSSMSKNRTNVFIKSIKGFKDSSNLGVLNSSWRTRKLPMS